MAESTYVKSAAKPSELCGVPTQIKCRSASLIADTSVVKVNRPDAISWASKVSRPGS